MTVGAVGHGQMRAAHADREHAIEVLKAAFVHGRLDRDEFDLRIGRALASRTYADLAALTADITAPGVGLPAQGGRPWLPEPARKLTKNKKAFGVLVGATSVYPGLLFIPPWLIPADGSPFVIPFLLLMFVLYAAVPTGWLIVFHSWLDKRAGNQSAQRLPAHSP
jgi:hypothetical protein